MADEKEGETIVISLAALTGRIHHVFAWPSLTSGLALT
jgi:hypothetical protein